MVTKYSPNDSFLGQRFNNLTIVGFEKKSDQWYMVVRCDCGTIKTETYRKLSNGMRKTCGEAKCSFCLEQRKINGRKAGFTGYEEIYGCKWDQWKLGAKKRGLEFSITLEYAWQLYLKQNRKCALSGVAIEFGTSWNRKISASLDRIDSSKGYIVGNVQWVHKRINVMKNNDSDTTFVGWCARVMKHQESIGYYG